MSSSSPSPSPSSPSSPNQQPIHRPAQWQLSGDALGYLIVLSPNDLIQPQARLALKTQKTIIGSSAELSTICLEDPMIDPVHLIINIHTESKHNRASIQIIGSTGIRLNQPENHIHPSSDPIPLKDRDTFHINQFPFRWEQRWDHQLIDWSRFTLENPQTLLLDILPEDQQSFNHNTTPSKSPPHHSSPKLHISPTKANQDLSFHWEQDHQQSPTKSPLRSPDPSNISFQRRSYRKSSDLLTTQRKIPNATDVDSSSDDEDDQKHNQTTDHPDLNSNHHSSEPLTSSPRSPTSSIIQDSSTNIELSPSQPRRKSLLQKLLIKQAVQVHMTHQSDLGEPSPVASSGFSSSDDDDNLDQDDEPDSTDEERATQPNNDIADNSSDEDRSDPPPARMVASSPSKTTLSPSGNTLNQPNHSIGPVSPGAIFSAKPRSISSASHFNQKTVSLPSSVTRPVFDRRSISPNAKLLSSFQNEQSSHSPSPSTTSLVFPLKSSFRKQSYSTEELMNFSPPLSASTCLSHTSQTPLPSLTARLATVRYNTQLNSRTPSFPLSPAPPPPPPSNEEVIRNRLRSRLRASAPASCSFASEKQIENRSASSSNTPHRIIRTPRSFLIKRRGSLTPLTAPVCGHDPATLTQNSVNHPEQESMDDDYDYEHMAVGDEKRKVRFDRDVFCLEFDQLPEELPLSRQRKRVKVDVEEGEAVTETTDNSECDGQGRNTLPTSSDLNNRPRRHSPRLPPPSKHAPPPRSTSPPPPSMIIEKEDGHPEMCDSYLCAGSESMSISSALNTVDLSSLSINASSSGQAAGDDIYPSLEEPVVKRGSMIETLTARLFPVSGGLVATPCVETNRGRRASLPSDLGRLGELQNRLGRLNLSTSSSSLPDEPGLPRVHSAPTPGAIATFVRPARGISFPPSVAAFSPRLTGVKQLFMGPIGGLQELGSGIQSFLSGLRSPRSSAGPDDSNSESSSSSSDDDDNDSDDVKQDGDNEGSVDGLDTTREDDDRQASLDAEDPIIMPILPTPSQEKPVPSRRPTRRTAQAQAIPAVPGNKAQSVASPIVEPRKPRGRPPRHPPTVAARSTQAPKPSLPDKSKADLDRPPSSTSTTTIRTRARTTGGPTLRPRRGDGSRNALPSTTTASRNPPRPLPAAAAAPNPAGPGKPKTRLKK